MTERNQPAAIKFSLEETVWFRKGAEIEDLISLSLEPDVTIQDLEQFVSIRGALKMSGEYIKSGQPEQEENQNYQVSGQKYVTIFDERDDGISKFQYEFPVDITIPKSRIVNFDDLDMVIDTFDYTMNEPNGLTLMTEVLISGVESENADVYDRNDLIEESNPNEGINHVDVTNQAETEEESRVDAQEIIELEANVFDDDRLIPLTPKEASEAEEESDEIFTVERSKSIERKEDQEEDQKDIPIPIQVVTKQDHNFIELDTPRKQEEKESENEEVVALSAETSNNSNRTEKEAVQDEKNPLKTVSAKDVERRNEKQERQEEKQPDREQISTVTQPIESISEDNQTEQAEAFVREEEDSREEEVLEQEEELLEDEEKVIDLEDKRTEKSINYQSQDEQEEKEISLTQFFARKDENRAARMKIYIVQENDSLNDIAEKYEVSVSQLLRLNQLEPHQDVYEGQLLSIPVKQNSQS